MMTGRSRTATWDEIENEFGPLVEIPPKADGDWDTAAIHEARLLRLLWTRVDPGLVSTGFHYVNLETYFRAARPYGVHEDVVEVDPDIVECPECGDMHFEPSRGRCAACEAGM